MRDYVVFIAMIFFVNNSYLQKKSKIDKTSKDYQKLYDSIFSIEKTKSSKLQLKYETEKKNLKIVAYESNIALLETKNKVKKVDVI